MQTKCGDGIANVPRISLNLPALKTETEGRNGYIQTWVVLFSLVEVNISATPPASLKIQVPVFY